jgi:hypothetical protein
VPLVQVFVPPDKSKLVPEQRLPLISTAADAGTVASASVGTNIIDIIPAIRNTLFNFCIIEMTFL